MQYINKSSFSILQNCFLAICNVKERGAKIIIRTRPDSLWIVCTNNNTRFLSFDEKSIQEVQLLTKTSYKFLFWCELNSEMMKLMVFFASFYITMSCENARHCCYWLLISLATKSVSLSTMLKWQPSFFSAVHIECSATLLLA